MPLIHDTTRYHFSGRKAIAASPSLPNTLGTSLALVDIAPQGDGVFELTPRGGTYGDVLPKTCLQLETFFRRAPQAGGLSGAAGDACTLTVQRLENDTIRVETDGILANAFDQLATTRAQGASR